MIFNDVDKKISDLRSFEKRVAGLWNSGELPYYVHLSEGNERQLIKIFNEIDEKDYVCSTHRSHYHYLLKGGSSDTLMEKIKNGESMHIIDCGLNFYSTAIVAGGPAIATGLAAGLKRMGSDSRVWCFVGDGAEDEGNFYESVKYVDGMRLPCTFIIEDNDRSVESSKKDRFGEFNIKWPNCVRRYNYKTNYPHAGTGEWVDFSGFGVGGNM